MHFHQRVSVLLKTLNPSISQSQTQVINVFVGGNCLNELSKYGLFISLMGMSVPKNTEFSGGDGQ